MKFWQFIVIVSLAIPIQSAWSQDAEVLSVVRVIFQNTTTAPVDIFLVDDSNVGAEQPEEVEFAPGLPAQSQHLQETFPETLWRIKSEGKVIAEYLTNESSIQAVDLAELVSWQTPVTVVIQNTTTAPVDIIWMDEQNEEHMIAEQLPAQREISSASLPGHAWLIKQGGKIIAEFVVDNHVQQVVDVQTLSTWLSPVEVIFQNKTDSPIEIYWVNEHGEEIRYTTEDQTRPKPLPPGQRMRQTALPLSLWRVRGADGELLAEYTPDNQPQQIVDIAIGDRS